jgi:hypothetical protein
MAVLGYKENLRKKIKYQKSDIKDYHTNLQEGIQETMWKLWRNDVVVSDVQNLREDN